MSYMNKVEVNKLMEIYGIKIIQFKQSINRLEDV